MPDQNELDLYYRELIQRNVRLTSIHTIHAQLKCFFTYLEKKELYSNICKNIEIPRGAYRERICLNKDEVNFLMRADIPEKERAMIALMIFCGLRCVEVSEMLWGDIRGCHALIRGKGRLEKNTEIYLPQTVLNAIDMWKRVSISGKESDDYVFKIENKPKSWGFIPCRPESISGRLRHILKDVFPDKPGLSAHCLRHTAITLAIESGMEMYRVTKFARHTSPATTMIYIHDNQRFTDPAENRIEALVEHAEESQKSEKNADIEQAVKQALKQAFLNLLK